MEHSMSQYVSKDEILRAVMAENEQLKEQLAAAQAAVPDDWRDKFSESVYEDLSAACNQDVPLEEYPPRILNILDAIVGPRHPTVIKWRNDAIRSCIAIAYKYCSDPESHRYLKQDLEAMLAATAHHAEGVQPSDKDLRDKVARALGCGTGTNYAWSYLLAQIESLVACEEEFMAMKQSTKHTTHGLDAPNERGWVCQHPQYGRWFISRKSILEDLNTYRKEVGGEAATLDCESVDIWWAEQCGWPEIAAYGKQLSRPDMDAQEKEFLNLMKRDTKNVSFHFEQEEIQVTK